MRTIGLIGGMSWESTRIYYELINRGVRQALGGLHSAQLLLSSLDMAVIARMQHEGRWGEAADRLAAKALRLQRAGAEVIAVAANTMHKCAPQILAAISVPFVHIVDPLTDALKSDHRMRPLLLATRFTMEDRFFLERVETAGLSPSIPELADRVRLHGIIFEELCKGVICESARHILERITSDAKSAGADCVILGCTELGLLVGTEPLALPAYDTAVLHAQALVRFALA